MNPVKLFRLIQRFHLLALSSSPDHNFSSHQFEGIMNVLGRVPEICGLHAGGSGETRLRTTTTFDRIYQ
jgi:hypothetical protein